MPPPHPSKTPPRYLLPSFPPLLSLFLSFSVPSSPFNLTLYVYLLSSLSMISLHLFSLSRFSASPRVSRSPLVFVHLFSPYDRQQPYLLRAVFTGHRHYDICDDADGGRGGGSCLARCENNFALHKPSFPPSASHPSSLGIGYCKVLAATCRERGANAFIPRAARR